MPLKRQACRGFWSLLVLTAATNVIGQEPGTPEPSLPKVEGMAVNHLGGGVPDATVTVWREGKKLAETRTSATGEFAVPIDLHEICTITVEIRCKGYAPFKAVTEFDPKLPPYVDTELVGALGFRGKVLRLPNRSPLSSAAVRLSIQAKTIEATSGEDGSFSMVGVPPGAGRLEVSAEGFGRELMNVKVTPDAEPVTVEMKQERRIAITLTDDLENPISGAAIDLQTEGALGIDLRTQKTDDRGQTIFRNVHYDTTEARARVSHPDLVQTTAFDHTIEINEKKLRSEASIAVPRGAGIRGKVVDAATGNPVHSARVIAGTPGQGFVPQAFTDLDGTFLLTALAAGKHPVTVHHVDYAAELREVDCAPGQVRHADLQLNTGKPLGGVLVDPQGKPIPGCLIESTLWKGYDTLSMRMFADETGKFLFEHAPADEIRFAVRSPDGRVLAKDVTLSAGKTDHIVTLKPAEAPMPLTGLAVGDPAPGLTLKTLDGRKIDAQTIAGQYVFLDFWATWCGPCVAELPNLQKLYRALEDRSNVYMISISLDQNEKALRAFLEKNHMPWLHVFGESAGAADAADAYGVSAIPATFLIGPDGKIIDVNLRGAQLAERVLDRIPKKDSDTPRAPALR